MRRYYRESTYHRQVRFIKLFKKFILLVSIVLVCAGGFLVYDVLRTSKQSEKPSAPTAQVNSTFASTFEVYRTEYFQFQAPKSWSAISNESSATKFVYRKFNKHLVEAQLVIYVNQPADQSIDANRVLPVTLNATANTLDAESASGICSTDIKNRGYKTMSLAGVMFRCNTDATDYTLLVGKKGGNTLLDMRRPDGSKVTYVIHFRDLRSTAIPQDIESIINTFQTR